MPFISFEGIDASGKTTQLSLLAERLRAEGLTVLTTREAGGTPLGREIRRVVQEQLDLAIDPLAEALLYAADRAQHIKEVIIPALDEGCIVLTDRYIDSSIAFQGAVLGKDIVREINAIATIGVRPDLTFLLDFSAAASKKRLAERGMSLDRIEQRDAAYQEQVRSIYLQLAEEEPQRIVLMDADKTVEQLSDEIFQSVMRRLVTQKE